MGFVKAQSVRPIMLGPWCEAQVHKARGEAQAHEEEVHGPFVVNPNPLGEEVATIYKEKEGILKQLGEQQSLEVYMEKSDFLEV